MTPELQAAMSALAPLLSGSERGKHALARESMRALPGGYRRLVSALAEARALGATPHALLAAQQLALRAHALLYVPKPAPIGASLLSLFRELPGVARAYRASIALAIALFLGGATFGYFEVRRDMASAAALASPAWLENAEHFAKDDVRSEGSSTMTAFYFSNNSKVALAAYIMGITFGVGTLLAMIYNGLVIGVTLAWVAPRGGAPRVFEWLLAHGGVELMAIFLAAGAGLAMGRAMLRPGWRTRTDALRDAARASLPLAVGAMLMLAIAGILEGWVSPLHIGWVPKAAIGFCTTVPLIVWLSSAGRVSDVKRAPTLEGVSS